MSVALSPSSSYALRTDLLKAIALAAGFGIAYTVDIEKIISTIVDKASDIIGSSSKEEKEEGGMLSRAKEFIDVQSTRVELYYRLKEWDEEHPYLQHRTVARVAVGVVGYVTARSVLKLLF